MIPLSDATRTLLDAVIEPDKRDHIASRLREQVSENIPFCDNSSPEGMERIRFSVLRLLVEGRMQEDDIFELAAIDWRDLFLAAGHGSPEGHRAWAARAISDAATGAPPSCPER